MTYTMEHAYIQSETMKKKWRENKKVGQKTSVRYRIKLKGLLPQPWTVWFEDMTITYEAGNTILIGWIEDQARLHGILNKIRDLNLILLSLETLEERQ